MYQRLPPCKHKTPQPMFLVYDPGPGPQCADIKIKPRLIHNITENGYVYVSPHHPNGKGSERWDDYAYKGSGAWLVATLAEAVEIYQIRLQARVDFRKSQLEAAQSVLDSFRVFCVETPFFDETAWEAARFEATRPHRLNPPDNHNP